MSESSEANDDIFNILLATDVHLGYLEKDPIRGNDTFATFEEILKIAVREQVDFILLGGDLFHDTNPSTYCVYKCIELIRKYCLGDRPVVIEFLSDQSRNFQHSSNPVVNYEDPNLNVSIPVFSIHGNHDDPTGQKQISVMDLLDSTNLVNYFGRCDKISSVEIEPILLQKGATKLAIYGLSHIRDERLARLFLDKKVSVNVPNNIDDWFNLFVLHQNRANRGVKNFIPLEVIPEFFDLVFWGHEHDCRIEPQTTPTGIYVTQPGSSVATSLCEGESLEKHVGILKINNKQFHLQPIKLETVRPFVFGEILLDFDAGLSPDNCVRKAERDIIAKIEEMIRDARKKDNNTDVLPLIRLIVYYQNEKQVFNSIRFGQKYTGRIANLNDMLKFKSKLPITSSKNKTNTHLNINSTDNRQTYSRVEDILFEMDNDDTNQLNILSLTAFTECVKKLIDTQDNQAPDYYMDYQCEQFLNKLFEKNPTEDQTDDCIEMIKQEFYEKDKNSVMNKIGKMLNERPQKNITNENIVDLALSDDDDNDSGLQSGTSTSISTPAKGPGGRGSRGGRGKRGGRRGRAKV